KNRKKPLCERDSPPLGNLCTFGGRNFPATIKNAAKTKYPAFRFDRDAKKIIKGKKVLYQVALEKRETEIEATFKSDGSFVKEHYD
ncbi:hypothetical protein, partial [Candidatus Symbiothrix dinenymphae]|uniref:hypothetical protein n=1 Tax=Candidatus Symbiothrix dinenymphae TaxID=467085 RepID=UPI000B090631